MKTNRVAVLALAVALLTSGMGMTAAVATSIPAQAAVAQSEVKAAVDSILNATNAERADLGLKPLILSTSISKISQAWTEKQASENYLHHNPNFRYQMPPGAVFQGENCAEGPFGERPQDFVKIWMNSPGHRAAIVGDYTHIGIGFAQAENGQFYSTQNFGKYPVTAPTIPNVPQINETSTSTGTEVRADWDSKWDTLISDHTAVLYLGEKVVDTQKPYGISNFVTFKNLKPGTRYTMKLTAHAFTPDSGTMHSPVRSTTFTTRTPNPPASAPNPPTNFEVVALGDTYGQVMWKAPTGVFGYIHSYTITLRQAGKADRVFTQNADMNSQMMMGLSKGTSYSVQVKAHVVAADGVTAAVSPAGTFTFRTTGSVATSPPTNSSIVSVNAPTGLKNTVGYNQLTASWSASKGTVGKLSGYTATLKIGSKVVMKATTPDRSYKFTGLLSNTGYTVEVKANAVSLNGVKKASSSVVTARSTTAKSPLVKVSAPVLTTSKLGHDRVTVSWKKPAVTGSLTSYRILVKKGTRVLKTYNLKPSVLSQTVTGLQEKTKYETVVEAYATSQDGKQSAKSSGSKAIITATSPASTVKVSPPARFSVSSETTSVNASWKKPAVTGKVAGYTVTLKQGTKTVKSYTTTSERLTFTGLKRKTSYDVQVRANAVSANGKYQSSSATLKKSTRTK